MISIFNVRLGHANNSSSSHSLILLKSAKEKLPEADLNYGWDNFTLVSKEAKTDYLATILYQSLQSQAPANLAAKIVEKWTGVDADRIQMSEATIDHQSARCLPANWNGSGIDEEFFKDLREYLLTDGLVILGGNDNSDGHPLAHKNTNFSLGLPDDFRTTTVARKDKDYWSLFNRSNGTKIRFSMNPGAKAPQKSSLPELVDVKITDFCSFDCPFCYQNSTRGGKHAPTADIKKIAQALGEMKVFEVALGGGEPTLHPNFIEILRSFRSEGVVPNFTTKSLAWLNNDQQREEILHSCGSFAFSVQNPKHIEDLLGLVTRHEIDPARVSVQLVMGITDQAEFEAILKKANESHLRITLLGYKTVGRGLEVIPHDYSSWFTSVLKSYENHDLPELAIDTKLAQDWLPSLVEAEIPSWLYSVTEGAFSCYIDAVAQKIGPSSFCAKQEYRNLVPFTQTPEEISSSIAKEFSLLNPSELSEGRHL